MNKKLLLVTFFTFAVIVFIHPFAFTYNNGLTAPGYAGAPGENNCTNSCHGSFAVNSGNGSLAITVLDQNTEVNEYIAGKKYTVKVSISHTAAKGFGFQATVKSNGAADAGIISTGGNSDVKKTIAGNYITHTNPVAHHEGMDQWTFEWTAPENGSDAVTFYTAGNAANLNSSTTGDYIYTTSKTLQPSTTSIADIDAIFSQNVKLYPNPVQQMLSVEYTLPGHLPLSEATLEIFTIDGELIKTEKHNPRAYLNTAYVEFAGLAKGVYLLKINIADKSAIKQVFKQ